MKAVKEARNITYMHLVVTGNDPSYYADWGDKVGLAERVMNDPASTYVLLYHIYVNLINAKYQQIQTNFSEDIRQVESKCEWR